MRFRAGSILILLAIAEPAWILGAEPPRGLLAHLGAMTCCDDCKGFLLTEKPYLIRHIERARSDLRQTPSEYLSCLPATPNRE